MRVRVLGACLVTALLTGGCDFTTEWNPAQLAHGKTDPAVRKLEMGRDTYATYCVGCHGEKGDGAGPAARFLDPKPRDFRTGRLKFASVESGAAPRDEDYMKTITEGLAGTAMPSFALLTSTEREAVIAYVKSFRTKPETPGDRLPMPKDPFAGNAAAGELAGEKVYHQFVKCWSCHPSYATPSEMTKWAKEANTVAPPLRPNAYESETKDSEWGAPIRAPDFLQDRVKTGFAVDGLARVIGSGIGGTAMPTWAAMLKPDQLWGLAYYVRKIALMRGTRGADELRRHLAAEPPPPPSQTKDDEE